MFSFKTRQAPFFSIEVRNKPGRGQFKATGPPVCGDVSPIMCMASSSIEWVIPGKPP